MVRHHVLSGADRMEEVLRLLKGRRAGLMTNPTGISHDLKSTADILFSAGHLTALYAPEHGIRGDAQAGEAVPSFLDEETGIRVFSAYGNGFRFTQEMLDAMDVLVFDIQDVGARFYTYLYSLSCAMEACSRAGKSVIVLDRINPLGGIRTCGTVLDPAFSSPVGDYELPTQYALTIGEYALYVKDYLRLDVDLTVVPLSGWERWMRLDDTDLPWVMTSPNLPGMESMLCYTGTCIFEGTNVSEGRGTTVPFQVVGAPYIRSGELERQMAEICTPGIHFRRTSFVPTFSKYAGKTCHGVQMHILDRDSADAFAAGLLLCDRIRSLYPEAFAYTPPDRDGGYAIDRLLGTDVFRTGSMTPEELIRSSEEKVKRFVQRTQKFHLYEGERAV